MATWQTVPPTGRVAEPDPAPEQEADHGMISVRNVDPDLWRGLRIAALRRGITVGAALNEAMAQWLNALEQIGYGD